MVLLINMTISVTLLSIVILVLRILFKNKIPGGLIYALWAILVLRILLPVLPESSISIYNYLPTFTVREESIYRLQALNPVSEESEVSYYLVGGKTEYAKVKYIYGDNKEDYILLQHNKINLILAIWAGVAFLLFLYYNIGIIRFTGHMKHYEVCGEETTLGILHNMQALAKIERPVTVCYFNGSPFVKGFLKPIVFIPKIYDSEELTYVFLHELIHIKHKDYLIDYISMILICLNWFNPVVWYAFIQLKKDAEIYCDEAVVELLGGSREYARILVKASCHGAAYKPLASFIGNNTEDLKDRITKLTYKRSINLRRAVLFSICLIACFTVFFTNELPISSKETDMGRIPVYLKEHIEQTILQQCKDAETTEILYLCEDAKNIYVYAEVTPRVSVGADSKEKNSEVKGEGNNGKKVLNQCFLVIPIYSGKDDEVADGTYYVDVFQRFSREDTKYQLCNYQERTFLCGSLTEIALKEDGYTYKVPERKEAYGIYELIKTRE